MIPETRDELIAGLRSGIPPGEIEFEQLNKIVLYEPDEMIVMCEPGISLEALDEELKKNHQWIAPLLPDEREDRTLVEALARNTYHPRTRFSSPLATSVLGGTFVTFKGEVFKSGSRVVKSVAGYDTHRAFVGSESKLFLPLEFTLKVMPRPKEFIRFVISVDARSEVLKRRPLIVEEWEGKLIVELAGEPEDIAEDRLWLNEQSLLEREVTHDWSKIVIEISQQRSRQLAEEMPDPLAASLLLQLQDRINT